jgi:hypothetical protein
MKDRACAKIVPGFYTDGAIAFSYGLEAAMAPFNDGNDRMAGKIEFIGNINSGIHVIDDGSSFFSGGDFVWTNKNGKPLIANSVRSILHECGFNTNLAMSKRRFHSVLYLNLLTPIPDWSGGAGKTTIESGQSVSLVLYIIVPTIHGNKLVN